MSEKLITTPYGRITPDEYAIKIAEEFPGKAARREPGEILIKKQVFFLQELAERVQKGPVFMKNLKEINGNLKLNFSKGQYKEDVEDETGKHVKGEPIPMKAGLSIGRLMKDSLINRRKPETLRYIYYVDVKGEELLNTVTPTPEVIAESEKVEISEATAELADEEEVE